MNGEMRYRLHYRKVYERRIVYIAVSSRERVVYTNPTSCLSTSPSSPCSGRLYRRAACVLVRFIRHNLTSNFFVNSDYLMDTSISADDSG